MFEQALLRMLPYLEINVRIFSVDVVVSLHVFRKAVRFKLINTETGKEINTMETVVLHVDKKIPVTIAGPVDSKGRPAKIDGQPEVTITPDGSGGTAAPIGLFVKDDGSGFELIGMLPTAEGVVAQVTIKGDADLGTGIKAIQTTFQVQCLAAEAVGFAFAVGAEVDA